MCLKNNIVNSSSHSVFIFANIKRASSELDTLDIEFYLRLDLNVYIPIRSNSIVFFAPV